jgi:hypothetical protein
MIGTILATLEGLTEWDIMYIWISELGFPILIVAIVALGVAWGIWEFWVTPKESKELRTAKRRKQPVALSFDDSHRVFFQRLVRVGASGAASTHKRYSDRKAWIGFFSRKSTPQFYKPTDAEVAADNWAGEVDELQSSKLFLADSKIPITVNYKGKALLTSFYALAGIQAAELASRLDGGEEVVTEPCSYCGQAKEPLKVLTKVGIDITRFFKSIANLKAWDESAQRENQIDAFGHGMEEAKRGLGKQPIVILLVALGFCFGMAILFLVSMKVLGYA